MRGCVQGAVPHVSIDWGRPAILPWGRSGRASAVFDACPWHASRSAGTRSVNAGRGGTMMSTQGAQLYGTYRCPVCGHRDAVELEADESSRVLACSYCNTSLEVTAR